LAPKNFVIRDRRKKQINQLVAPLTILPPVIHNHPLYNPLPQALIPQSQVTQSIVPQQQQQAKPNAKPRGRPPKAKGALVDQ
jgi:hypothetical protein